MSTATVGRAAEHFVRDRLRAEGYEVIRAAGSKGVADLVAVFPERGQCVFVSVKVNSWPSAAEMRSLTALARRGTGVPFLVIILRRRHRRGWDARVVYPAKAVALPAWGNDPLFLVAELQ